MVAASISESRISDSAGAPKKRKASERVTNAVLR